MVTRRVVVGSGLVVAAQSLLPDAEAATEESDCFSFHVYDGTPPGCLAWEADRDVFEATTAEVVAYELVGMPETFDTYARVEVDPPARIGAWLDAARFPADAWGEPTFVRVFWQEPSV